MAVPLFFPSAGGVGVCLRGGLCLLIRNGGGSELFVDARKRGCTCTRSPCFFLCITLKPGVERCTKSMSLRYEPASESLHLFVNKLFCPRHVQQQVSVLNRWGLSQVMAPMQKYWFEDYVQVPSLSQPQNPKPQTPNHPKPETRNPKPETRNPKPENRV